VYCSSTSLTRSLQHVFSRWISVLVGTSQFLTGLWPAHPPLLLLHLPRLFHPNHGFGRDRVLCLLVPCVLVMVPTGVIDAEPLRRFGWICGLVGGVALRGCLRRLGV
jgi:hypothetical protein